MKNYNEIAKSVLSRRDQYEEAKRIKKQNITQISTAIVCIVTVTAVSFGIVRRNWLKTQIVELMPFLTEDSSSTSKAINATTSASSSKRPTSPTTVPATTQQVSTTTSAAPYEDWERKSMPGKFFGLSLNSIQTLNAIIDEYSQTTTKNYIYPFSHYEERSTTRNASLLVTDIPIESIAPDGTLHTALVDIYSLEGLSEELALGVKFKDDSRIYTYVCSSYIPSTLGEFLDAVDYDNTVSYGGIYLPTGTFPVNAENAADIKNYLLSNRSIPNIMTADGEATGECIVASINCRELGIEGHHLYIYEDGHIIINLLSYEYSFFVGKEAVANFLKDSYNITFEQIKELTGTTQPLTMMTTSPTTEPTGVPTTTAIPTTGETSTTASSETVSPPESIDSNTSAASVIAEEPSVTSDITTTTAPECTVEVETTTWWCGTKTE